MADEENNQLERPSEAETRIKELSSKVRSTSEERDEAKRLNDESTAKMGELSKERDFYASFSDVVSLHPAAKDHKDDILGKVKSGYTVEDATFAVLAKAGKLATQAPAAPEPVNPAGGSASFSPPQTGTKSLSQMTSAEKKQALIEAEQRGDIGMT